MRKISKNSNFKQTEIGRIPKEWEVVRLSDIGNLKDGDWILKENYTESGVRLLQVGDIGIGKFLNKSERFINPQRAKELGCTYITPKEDILISRMPDPIGRACVAPEFSYPYIVAVDITILRSDKNKVLPDYIIYPLNSNLFLSKVKQLSQGATRQRISRTNLEEIQLPLPPLPEQKKIAEVLTTADEAIQKVDEAIEKTERLKKGLMQELLTKGIWHRRGGVTPPLQETEIGRIPKEWEVTEIKGVGKVLTGKTPPTANKDYWNGDIPFVTPFDIGEEKYVHETERYISTKGAQKVGNVLPKDAVLVVCIGSTIGKIALTFKESISNQQINALICNDGVNPTYVYYAISSRSNFLKSFSGTAAVPIIKKSLFETFKIPFPPLPEQQKISEILGTVDKRLELLGEKKERFERIKIGLMEELLTGKRRVIL